MFGRVALLALLRRPQRGTCGWCCATVVAAATSEPQPDPTSPAAQALLGRPCRRCASRFQAAEAAAAERVHVEQLAAAGLHPAAAGRVRTPERVAALAASIRGLEAARPPTAPTGVIWPTRAGRRVPDPPYYTPGRRGLR